MTRRQVKHEVSDKETACTGWENEFEVEINNVKFCKYLGILIDDEISWTQHIEYVYDKIVKFTGIFYKTAF